MVARVVTYSLAPNQLHTIPAMFSNPRAIVSLETTPPDETCAAKPCRSCETSYSRFKLDHVTSRVEMTT